MIHFLTLVRYKNLIIIALTFYSIRFFYFELFGLSVTDYSLVIFERLDFFLLVLSTLFIAASGNVINDYFDIKADRINKPDKMIVGKYVSKRSAIKLQWILNSLAIIIAVYLSIKHRSFWFVGIHFVAINILWIYSMYYKRSFFIGNLVVALLTALVPFISGIYFYLLQQDLFITKVIHESTFTTWIQLVGSNGGYIYGFIFFAFIMNLSREILKDITDIKGDLELKAKTVAIVSGESKARKLAASFLLASPVFLLYIFFKLGGFTNVEVQFFLPLLVVQLLLLFVAFGLLFSFMNLTFHQKLLKIGMLIGIIIPVYWKMLELL